VEKVIQIAKEIKKNNGYCYINGGYVRDKVLGYPSKDIDVEVYKLNPQILFNILSKFGTPKLGGKSFGVFKLDEYDFSLPRREKKIGSKHTDFDVECDKNMTPEEACIRRDLTINALLMDPFTNSIYDYYGGLDDIKNKIIRHVSNKFSEDPLRVIRVARFSSRFEFEIYKETKLLCESLLCELKYLPKERFFTEFESILLKSKNPSIAFNFLSSIGIIESYYPELDVLKYIEQGEKYHPEGSVWNHVLMALDQIPLEERTLTTMLAILCHDMGKAIVKQEDKGDGHISFKYHADDGVYPAEKFLKSITNETQLINNVLNLVKHHMRPYDLKKQINKNNIRRLALTVDIPSLMIVHKADKLRRGYQELDLDYIQKMIKVYNEIKDEVKPLIQGRHLIELGLEPGNYFGPILKQIFELQINGEFSNIEDRIKLAKERNIICLK